MKKLAGLCCVAAAMVIAPVVARAQATLAATPPMGWNSWNHYHSKVDDAIVRSMADAMVSSGMRELGYTYVNIDDTWQGERDAQGVLHPNARFPDMKALADYVHSKGLKFGIYSSPGALTCDKLPGSYQFEEQDAKMYAAWGVDYVKYDLCGFRAVMKAAGSPEAAHQAMVDAYAKMHKAILATGRPMVYSLCQYGNDAVWEWGAGVGGNLWRTTQDVRDTYASMETIGFGQSGLGRFAGPGHWNDPDLLEIGNGGMNTEEYRTQMTLWSMLAAPLIATNDLSDMTPANKALLTNKDVIAIDQDPLGKEGDRVYTEGPVEVWERPLVNGATAVAIFNRHPLPLKAAIDLSKLGFGNRKARDLWAGTDLKVEKGPMKFNLLGHSVVLLRISK
ncbi:MAG: glycoside hydrolase family 27 protein [Acidobacteriota bacterium]